MLMSIEELITDLKKKEIAKDVLMITICDTESDTSGSDISTFNIG